MFNIKIAGIPITIDNHYDFLNQQCRDYLTDIPSKITLSVSEKEMMQEIGEVSGYAESLCIYRSIALTMNEYEGILMHATVIDGTLFWPGTRKEQ